MHIRHWVARCAALIFRSRPPPTPDSALRRKRLAAARSLAARLSAHLRRDIGADDG
jgi:hypothetical protein